MALIRGNAGYRPRAGADAGLAGVGERAGVAVVAGGAVRLGRVRANARGRVARASVVALVERCAGHRVRAGAGAGLAGVGLGAGVAVVAGAPVRLGRVRANAVRRIAGADLVALVLRDAGDEAGAHAGAGLAGVGLGASVAVAAGGAVRSRGVGASAGCRIADAGAVALVGRRAG